MIAALFEMLNNEIPPEVWLERLALLENCRGVSCIWWRAGDTASKRQDLYGEIQAIPCDWIDQLERMTAACSTRKATMLESLALNAGCLKELEGEPLFSAKRMVACISYAPIRAFLFFENRNDLPEWTDTDRGLLADILPLVEKSILVKQRMSSYEDAIEITNKLFDEMPRGLVVVTVEGELVVASRMTRQLIETGRLFKSSEKYLEFDDPEIQGAFEEQLGSIAALPADALEKYVWHKNLTGTTGPDSYTASLLAFRYQNWKLESTACDRVAVLVINNQKLIGVPAIEHIREFYRLTNAQARVVTALFKGESVEEASTALNISPNTVRSHLRAIYSKLGVANKAALLQLVSTTTTGNRLASKIMG